jgi:hypothetical protein
VNRAVALTLALAFVLFGLSILSKPGLDLTPYPAAAAEFVDQQGLFSDAHRVAHMDYVGNFLELRYGRRVPVFIDDRYDMYPIDVSRDYLRLLAARPESLGILDQRGVDVVLWGKDQPLSNLLQVSGRWEQIYGQGDWVVFRRNG